MFTSHAVFASDHCARQLLTDWLFLHSIVAKSVGIAGLALQVYTVSDDGWRVGSWLDL